jgi:hypothetical protein
MLTVKKHGRKVYAMTMTSPVNDVYGVVQCAIDGCQAYMPLMAGHGESPPAEQIHEFMMGHDCDPKRFKLNRRTRP